MRTDHVCIVQWDLLLSPHVLGKPLSGDEMKLHVGVLRAITFCPSCQQLPLRLIFLLLRVPLTVKEEQAL